MSKIKERIEDIKLLLLDYKKELVIIASIITIITLSTSIFFIYQARSKNISGITNDLFMDDNSIVLDSEEKDNSKNNDSNEINDSNTENNLNDSLTKIKVDIKGQVKNPGVYELEENSRVIDVINLAGGTLDNADTTVNNLSKKIFDEMVIIIYSKEEINNFKNTKDEQKENIDNTDNLEDIIPNDSAIKDNELLDNNQSSNNIPTENINDNNNLENSKININKATIDELMNIPSIGEAKAKKIIEYRNTNGSFKSTEEITNVSGIGNSIYEKIKDKITI